MGGGMSHDEFVEMVRDAAALNVRWHPKHPQYIDGDFYLTQGQWDAVMEAWPRAEEPDRLYTVWGIPVHIIKPGDRITGKDGKTLALSPDGEALYALNPNSNKMFSE